MRNRNRNRRKKEAICLGIALICGALLTGLLLVQRGMLVEARARRAGQELSREVLRFHVLADSDSPEDQQRKLEVKEALLAYMEEAMPLDADLEETCSWVRENLDSLEQTAEERLREDGCSDPVRAELVRDYFPEKTYGDVTFPAGEYTALRILIGAGQGHNWWCCLYPSLCFTDAVTAHVLEEEKEELGRVLGEDEYDMITAYSDFRIRWFFFGDRD
mgnify:FL=1